MEPAFYGAEWIHRLLDYDGCIAAVRDAMAALSADAREQPLRSITDLGDHRLFGLMPGMLPGTDDFGAKLVSVFPDGARNGRAAHRGIVALFDGSSGHVAGLADAGAITEIRTGCASAVATAALAREDATRLAIFGCGAQARSHIRALRLVRPIEHVGVWGRSHESASAFAASISNELGCEVTTATDGEALAAEADIICTVTAASEPILLGEWVRPGTHVNVVGSSYAGPVEVDTNLVAKSRYFVDYRRSALVAASEFLIARDAGAFGDDHIAGEIGDVLGGTVPGRTSDDQITLYKSLGHVAQDLAALRYLLRRA